MDVDDGLDLDPYSPVGSTNTEMEELFNSPPRAEPTPKAAKGARKCLSGAGRKRLKHYKAKGLPIEQALAMAKQPLPNPLKRPKAGDSLKRGRSANTTPENNMPKRGSAKPGAGATPASVPELKAAPADEQAEQRAVTSAKKFPSGYPKALLSTKELSAVQEAILDVIRTQRQGAVKPFFTGCTFRPGWLLISCANRETADWLKAAMPKLKLWPGAKVELVADADMPKPQVYIGHFPKTEKYSNEDILQLLEGQNSALRTGDWRILNRVERGKQIELTFAVDPNSDEKLKSVGHRLCYGFGQSGSALLITSSTMAAPTANASAATTERPAHHRSPGCARPYMVGSKFITEDLVAVWAKVPTVCGEQEAVPRLTSRGNPMTLHPERYYKLAISPEKKNDSPAVSSLAYQNTEINVASTHPLQQKASPSVVPKVPSRKQPAHQHLAEFQNKLKHQRDSAGATMSFAAVLRRDTAEPPAAIPRSDPAVLSPSLNSRENSDVQHCLEAVRSGFASIESRFSIQLQDIRKESLTLTSLVEKFVLKNSALENRLTSLENLLKHHFKDLFVKSPSSEFGFVNTDLN
ncbi:hypothetical protein ACLKA6_002191 [Drosophila palustris]